MEKGFSAAGSDLFRPSPDAGTPEHRPLLRGRGRFLDDLGAGAGALELAFVRSPWAHARIRSIDAGAARRAPGVAAVVTGADLAGTVAPIRTEMATGGSALFRPTDWHPVAPETVRYAGEIVAVVAARDRYVAEDAAALVEVEYEPLPVVADARSASGEDAPRLHEHAPGNVLFRTEWSFGEGERERFERAPIRVRLTCRHPRVSGMPMEGSGSVAAYDRTNGTLEFFSSTQVPHILRDGLARSLGIAAGRIRVVAPDVGGGFGPKMQLLPEEVAAAALAVRLGHPVKWVQDRMEHLQSAFHSRDATVEAEAAAEADGRLVGLRASARSDVGAYSSFPLGCSLDPQTAGVALPGPYRLPYYHYSGVAVATNRFPTGAYRGVGFPLGPLVTETLASRIARAVGLDPAEVRRRNLLRPEELPHESPGGAVYDSGDYPALLQSALDRAPYAAWRDEQRRLEEGGGVRREARHEARRRLGVGLSFVVESTGMNRAVYRKRGMAHIPAFDSAVLRIDPEGGVEAFVSTPSQGQSHAASFRRLVGRALGVPEGSVRIVLGDTAVTPYGSGTFASRSMVSGGGAVLRAAAKMREKLRVVAAARWGTSPDDVRFAVRDGVGGAEPDRCRCLRAKARLRMVHRTTLRTLPPIPERSKANAPGTGSRLGVAELARLAHTPFQPFPAAARAGAGGACRLRSARGAGLLRRPRRPRRGGPADRGGPRPSLRRCRGLRPHHQPRRGGRPDPGRRRARDRVRPPRVRRLRRGRSAPLRDPDGLPRSVGRRRALHRHRAPGDPVAVYGGRDQGNGRVGDHRRARRGRERGARRPRRGAGIEIVLPLTPERIVALAALDASIP